MGKSLHLHTQVSAQLGEFTRDSSAQEGASNALPAEVSGVLADTTEGREALHILQNHEGFQNPFSRQDLSLLLRTAERLAPQPLLFARLMGFGVLFTEFMHGDSSAVARFHQELLQAGRDFLLATKSAIDSWRPCFHLVGWSDFLFQTTPQEQREQCRTQTLEFILRTVDQADHTLAEQHLDGHLGQQIGLSAIETSLRNCTILFATGTSDRLSLLANYAASVVSGYAQYQLSRTPLSMHSLLLSAVIGLINGATQSFVNITHQIGQMNEAQLRQNRTALVWQEIKGALIGAGSGFAERLVGQTLHGIPVTHPLAKMIISATAFSLGDVEGEKVTTDLLDWVGVSLGLEEVQLSQARGIYGFIENATQEVGGGLTHGLSPVSLLHLGGLGAAAAESATVRRSDSAMVKIDGGIAQAFVNPLEQMKSGMQSLLEVSSAYANQFLDWMEHLFHFPQMAEHHLQGPLALTAMVKPGGDLRSVSLVAASLIVGAAFSEESLESFRVLCKKYEQELLELFIFLRIRIRTDAFGSPIRGKRGGLSYRAKPTPVISDQVPMALLQLKMEGQTFDCVWKSRAAEGEHGRQLVAANPVAATYLPKIYATVGKNILVERVEGLESSDWENHLAAHSEIHSRFAQHIWNLILEISKAGLQLDDANFISGKNVKINPSTLAIRFIEQTNLWSADALHYSLAELLMYHLLCQVEDPSSDASGLIFSLFKLAFTEFPPESYYLKNRWLEQGHPDFSRSEGMVYRTEEVQLQPGETLFANFFDSSFPVSVFSPNLIQAVQENDFETFEELYKTGKLLVAAQNLRLQPLIIAADAGLLDSSKVVAHFKYIRGVEGTVALVQRNVIKAQADTAAKPIRRSPGEGGYALPESSFPPIMGAAAAITAGVKVSTLLRVERASFSHEVVAWMISGAAVLVFGFSVFECARRLLASAARAARAGEKEIYLIRLRMSEAFRDEIFAPTLNEEAGENVSPELYLETLIVNEEYPLFFRGSARRACNALSRLRFLRRKFEDPSVSWVEKYSHLSEFNEINSALGKFRQDLKSPELLINAPPISDSARPVAPHSRFRILRKTSASRALELPHPEKNGTRLQILLRGRDEIPAHAEAMALIYADAETGFVKLVSKKADGSIVYLKLKSRELVGIFVNDEMLTEVYVCSIEEDPGSSAARQSPFISIGEMGTALAAAKEVTEQSTSHSTVDTIFAGFHQLVDASHSFVHFLEHTAITFVHAIAHAHGLGMAISMGLSGALMMAAGPQEKKRRGRPPIQRVIPLLSIEAASCAVSMTQSLSRLMRTPNPPASAIAEHYRDTIAQILAVLGNIDILEVEKALTRIEKIDTLAAMNQRTVTHFVGWIFRARQHYQDLSASDREIFWKEIQAAFIFYRKGHQCLNQVTDESARRAYRLDTPAAGEEAIPHPDQLAVFFGRMPEAAAPHRGV